MPSDKEMINNLIDTYSNLQRIKNADNAEKELDYQLTLVKAKLESFGIATSDLDIKKLTLKTGYGFTHSLLS